MEVCPISKGRKRTPRCCIFQKGPSAVLSWVDGRGWDGFRGPSKEPMGASQVEGRGQPGQCSAEEGVGGILQEVGCLREGASSPHKDSGGEVGSPDAAGTSFSSRICY